MKIEQILSDWSEYDLYKSAENDLSGGFLTEDSWEVNFLIKKIKTHYPDLKQQPIVDAIYSCGRAISKPRQRRFFIQCVLIRLGV